MSAQPAGSSAISIAVPQWDVALRAHALLSESPMEDKVKATFDFKLHPYDMNSLFQWADSGTSGYLVQFTTGASTTLTNLLTQQVRLTPGVTLSGVTVSLATHFLCSQSDISMSAAMTSASINTTQINMIEEKILAVSEDIFNSTSAFTLFQPQSRLLLANDYYNLGREAYKKLMSDKLTPAVATGIYQNLVAYRQTTTAGTTFGEFINGDELTFNVIAVSSESQYEITPTADRNLTDRSYKFRIVAASGVTATNDGTYGATANSVFAGISTPSFLGQFIMGHTNNSEYMTIFNNYAAIENSLVGSTSFIDAKNTPKNYATANIKPDGSLEF
jgi:hypothetical protein